MGKIELSRGLSALVDDADIEYLSQWKWSASPGHKTFYAVRGEAVSKGKRRLILMHRHILGDPPFPKAEADHINGDGLDNRRENLRWCTHQQNRRNEPKKNVKSVSKFKGVSFDKRGRKNPWRAQIRINGKIIGLGSFGSEMLAAEAYNRAAAVHHGEFASLNAL